MAARKQTPKGHSISKGKMKIHAMEYFKNDLSLPCSCLKVKTKLKTKFCLRHFMNPILYKHQTFNSIYALYSPFTWSVAKSN